MSYVSPIEWTPAMIAKLGTASDQLVADELGIGKESVYSKRRKLGIPQSGITEWTPELEAALADIPDDEEFVRKFGLRIAQDAVRARRRKLGLPMPGFRSTVWTDEMLSQLGTMHDEELGPILGLHPHTVGDKRRRLGIKAWRKPKEQSGN